MTSLESNNNAISSSNHAPSLYNNAPFTVHVFLYITLNHLNLSQIWPSFPEYEYLNSVKTHTKLLCPHNPTACGCQVVGSMDSICDRRTGQCKCKSHVTGLKCSRCSRGYYQSRDKNQPCRSGS